MARKYLRVREYPGCCGVWNIFSFGGEGDIYGWMRHNRIPKDKLKARLVELKHNFRYKAFLTASLNNKQEAIYGATLRECGFELVGKSKNLPHHGSVIHLYVCKLNPVKEDV